MPFRGILMVALAAITLLVGSAARAESNLALGVSMFVDHDGPREGHEDGPYLNPVLAFAQGLGPRFALEGSLATGAALRADLELGGRWYILSKPVGTRPRDRVAPYLFGRAGALAIADDDCATACGPGIAGPWLQGVVVAGAGVYARLGPLAGWLEVGEALRLGVSDEDSDYRAGALVARALVGLAF